MNVIDVMGRIEVDNEVDTLKFSYFQENLTIMGNVRNREHIRHGL